MKVIVVGGGEIGSSLSNLLSQQKHDTTLVESSDGVAKKVASEVDAQVLLGEGTDISVLRQAGIEEADAVLACTDDDRSNLMICEIAKSMNVQKIISRVNLAKNAELFTKLDVISVVPSTQLIVTALLKKLNLGEERIITELGGGDVMVIEITLGKKSKLVDKPAVIEDAVIGSVYRVGELIIPKKETKLNEGDVLILLCKAKDLQKVRKVISGT